jgi:hypothetical protein
METEELIELRREAVGVGERRIAVTMAITAALLAMVTVMGHRLHTEEVILQTKSVDGWAFFQAKNHRSHMYATDAKLAELTGAAAAAPVVADWTKKSEDEKKEANQIRHETEQLDREAQSTTRRATVFDLSEVGLSVGIVLCSIALLTKGALYWYLSFVPILIGLGIAVFGLFLK